MQLKSNENIDNKQVSGAKLSVFSWNGFCCISKCFGKKVGNTRGFILFIIVIVYISLHPILNI